VAVEVGEVAGEEEALVLMVVGKGGEAGCGGAVGEGGGECFAVLQDVVQAGGAGEDALGKGGLEGGVEGAVGVEADDSCFTLRGDEAEAGDEEGAIRQGVGTGDGGALKEGGGEGGIEAVLGVPFCELRSVGRVGGGEEDVSGWEGGHRPTIGEGDLLQLLALGGVVGGVNEEAVIGEEEEGAAGRVAADRCEAGVGVAVGMEAGDAALGDLSTEEEVVDEDCSGGEGMGNEGSGRRAGNDGAIGVDAEASRWGSEAGGVWIDRTIAAQIDQAGPAAVWEEVIAGEGEEDCAVRGNLDVCPCGKVGGGMEVAIRAEFFVEEVEISVARGHWTAVEREILTQDGEGAAIGEGSDNFHGGFL